MRLPARIIEGKGTGHDSGARPPEFGLSDFAFIRNSVKQFLDRQPAQLAAPAELLVIGDDSLEMLQSYTRNQADLLNALNRLPPALPIKKMNGMFFWDRFTQSIDALQQIALQKTYRANRDFSSIPRTAE